MDAYSKAFYDFTTEWCKKYLIDETIKAHHEDFLFLYENFIADLKENKIQAHKYDSELDIRRIIDKLLSEAKANNFNEDHKKLSYIVAQLDEELKSLVYVNEEGYSKSDWWNYSFPK